MAAAPLGDRTEPAAAQSLDAVHDALRQRAALLIHHEVGVEVAVLEPGCPVVVGRATSDAVPAPASVAAGAAAKAAAPAGGALRINDRAMSRSHARFTLVGKVVRVEDLGSTNGTWIGGQRIVGADVTPGTEVKLGSVIARVHLLDRSELPAPSGKGAGAGARAEAADGDVVIGAALRGLFETAARVADSRLSVLVQGETGTGKEVLARYLHARSPRADKPFLSVNCGAIPGQLIESTLFGHERGAFTGAVQLHRGVFEAANGGTVFLDEIGELPLAAQAALLVVLESGRFSRVGSTKELTVDVRVVAASHKNLEAMAADGRFRADLFYRLQGATLRIPPLRERKDEIGPLVEKLVQRANAQHGRSVAGLAPSALLALAEHDWPGNVRELRNAVDQAVVIARGPVVMLEDLPFYLRPNAPSTSPAGSLPPMSLATLPSPSPTPSMAPGAAVSASAGASVGASAEEDGDDGADDDGADEEGEGELRTRVDQFEAKLIREALEATGFKRADAAKKLGLPLRTLARRIKLLGIKEPR